MIGYMFIMQNSLQIVNRWFSFGKELKVEMIKLYLNEYNLNEY